jgi:hypothetical protein
MAHFKRIVVNEPFLLSIVEAKNNPRRLATIIKNASPQNFVALAEIFKNLKHIPLTQAEKYRFCERRAAIKTFIKQKTKCAVRRSICLKRTLQTGSGVNQVGGILPLLPLVASLGTFLLSLFRKNNKKS